MHRFYLQCQRVFRTPLKPEVKNPHSKEKKWERFIPLPRKMNQLKNRELFSFGCWFPRGALDPDDVLLPAMYVPKTDFWLFFQTWKMTTTPVPCNGLLSTRLLAAATDRDCRNEQPVVLLQQIRLKQQRIHDGVSCHCLLVSPLSLQAIHTHGGLESEHSFRSFKGKA